MSVSAALKTEYNNSILASFVSREQASERFVNTLHHAHDPKHPGFIFTATKTEECFKQRADFVTRVCDPAWRSEHLNTSCDTYVSVNEFIHKKERVSENIFSLHAMMIDIDCHSTDSKSSVEAVIERVNELISTHKLPCPTAASFTGRGLALYYVLERSIACCNAHTQAQRRLFDFIYRKLTERVKLLLKGVSGAQVDLAVLDSARICRLPGTYNTNAGSYCEMYDFAPVYYSLNQLKTLLNVTEATTPVPSVQDKKIVTVDEIKCAHFSAERLVLLDKIAKLCDEQHKKAYHELLCFIYHSTALASYSREDADKLTEDFNSRFEQPLESLRLKSILRQKKLYRFKSDTIADMLNLTDEEAKSCGLYRCSQNAKRAASKELTAQKRSERDEMIIKYVSEHPDLKRKEWLAGLSEIGIKVSARTFDNIVKQAGLGKRKCTLAYTETAMYKSEKQRKQAVIDKHKTIIAPIPTQEPTKPILAKITRINKDVKTELSDLNLPTDINAKWDVDCTYFEPTRNEYYLHQKALDRVNLLLGKYEAVNAFYMQLIELKYHYTDLLADGIDIADDLQTIHRLLFYLPRYTKVRIKNISEKVCIELINLTDEQNTPTKKLEVIKKLVKRITKIKAEELKVELKEASEAQKEAWRSWRRRAHNI